MSMSDVFDAENAGTVVTFKDAVVRDLAWVMLSPGLINSSVGTAALVSDTWCQQTYVEHEAYLRQLDENPQPLLDYLSGLKSHRLGYYFEMLLAFWLEHILQVSPFQRNLPVFQEMETVGRRTIGEFDFLFGRKNQPTLSHWEATVKFYLCHENEEGRCRWLGPAGQDRFDVKLSRMFDHQLKLSETVEGRSVIDPFSTLGVTAEAFIKGYLFYPVSCEKPVSESECDSELYSGFTISPLHSRGWWLRFGENAFPKRYADSQWLLLPKLRWLPAAWCSDDEGSVLLNDADVVERCTRCLQTDCFPLLLAEMQRDNGGWAEVSRGFVVAPDWPAISQ